LKKQISDFEFYGNLHNDALMNVYLNFNDTVHSSLESYINSITNFNRAYFVANISDTTFSSINELNYLTERYKNFVVGAYLLDTLSSAQIDFCDQISILQSEGFIDKNEKSLLLRLNNTVLKSLNGEIDANGLIDSIYLYVEYFDSQNYCINQKFGTLSSVILNISEHSIEYWSLNTNQTKFIEHQLDPRVLPPWAAADIGGALWGATSAALWSGGNPSWKSLGKGALTGAVSGSTGIVGKIAKGIKIFF